MIDDLAEERPSAFAVWLRTGRRPTVRSDGVELKFNPYHDPRNGQFTFAPGGPQSLQHVTISDRPSGTKFVRSGAPRPGETLGAASHEFSASSRAASPVIAPDRSAAAQAAPQSAEMIRIPRAPRTTGKGSNSDDIPRDPVVLARVAPGLLTAPAGEIIAVVDNLLDIYGPQLEATAALTKNWSNILIDQIKAVDGSYRFDH